MEAIVNSYNLFIDTDRDLIPTSKGDDIFINLSDSGVNCAAGQKLRLTLTNFCMYKNFTDVNPTNSVFRIRDQNGETTGTIENANYDKIASLAQKVASAVSDAVIARSAGHATPIISCVISNVLPDSTTGIAGTTDNIIQFKLDQFRDAGNNAINHGFTSLILQCRTSDGDSFQLMGGDRIEDGDTVTSSWTVDITSNSEIIFTGKYPAQHSTSAYVYLRTNVMSSALEQMSLQNFTDTDRTGLTLNSNIFAKIPINTQFCVYNSDGGREYFVDVKSKSITGLRLYLTDAHNRQIGRTGAGDTAAGTGTQQSTKGNLSFTAVIRVDVLQGRMPQELETNLPMPNSSPRFSNLKIQSTDFRNLGNFA